MRKALVNIINCSTTLQFLSIPVPAAVLAQGSLTEDEQAVLREINRVMNSDYSGQPCLSIAHARGGGGVHSKQKKFDTKGSECLLAKKSISLVLFRFFQTRRHREVAFAHASTEEFVSASKGALKLLVLFEQYFSIRG